MLVNKHPFLFQIRNDWAFSFKATNKQTNRPVCELTIRSNCKGGFILQEGLLHLKLFQNYFWWPQARTAYSPCANSVFKLTIHSWTRPWKFTTWYLKCCRLRFIREAQYRKPEKTGPSFQSRHVIKLYPLIILQCNSFSFPEL